MAMAILHELQQDYVHSLFDEGIVNNQFTQLQTSKSTEEREDFVQMIHMYCVDVTVIFLDLKNCIDLHGVDFIRFAAKAHTIERKSLRVGAEQVRVACKGMIEACYQENKENVVRTFSWLSHEFSTTKYKLKAFMQMERRIIRFKQKDHQI